MNCDELRDSYELYALGIAEEPEAERDPRAPGAELPHLRAGRAERAGVDALIGAAAPAAEPPARLRKRVLAIAGGQTAARWNWSPVWAAVAAGALIAAVVFNVRGASRGGGIAAGARGIAADASRKRRPRSRELARLNEAFAILNQPNAKQVVFGGAAPQPPRGRVFLDPARGVLLLASNLPPAPAGKTYEMWVIPKGGKPVPAGLFQSAADGTAFHVLPGPVDIAGTAADSGNVEQAAGAWRRICRRSSPPRCKIRTGA